MSIKINNAEAIPLKIPFSIGLGLEPNLNVIKTYKGNY